MPTDVRGEPHRPLVSGIRIVNAVTGSPGTLGCIGLDADDKPWIISCYHVLGRRRQSTDIALNDEPILQSTFDLGGGVVARTRTDKMNATLDYGAAIIVPEIGVSTEVLELDKVQRIADAVVGMTVVKSGAETGVTMGIVTAATDTLITIEQPFDAAEAYVLSERGDSGAVWLDAQTGRAIGLHFSGRDGNTAFARPLGSVLTELGLRLLE
ncbi:MAG: S1 family peptidase [Gemmatimonadota bacterium]|nr:S1 family peptidase [Gemmatimonadota bacterium]